MFKILREKEKSFWGVGEVLRVNVLSSLHAAIKPKQKLWK